MDIGDRPALNEIKNWEDSFIGVKFHERGKRKKWADHHTNPIGFKSGSNSKGMKKRKIDKIVIVDSDSDEEEPKQENNKIVLISSDEENNCNDKPRSNIHLLGHKTITLDRYTQNKSGLINTSKKNTDPKNTSVSIKLSTSQEVNIVKVINKVAQTSINKPTLTNQLSKKIDCELNKIQLPVTMANSNNINLNSILVRNDPLYNHGVPQMQLSSGLASNQMHYIQTIPGQACTSQISNPVKSSILVTNVVDPLAQPKVHNSIAINVQNSLVQMAPQQPVVYNVLLPNTQLNGSNLVGKVGPVITSPGIIQTPQLVIYDPHKIQPYNAINNIHVPQVNQANYASNLNSQLVIMQSSSSHLKEVPLQNTPLTSEVGCQTASQALSPAVESREWRNRISSLGVLPYVNDSLIKLGVQNISSSFLNQSQPIYQIQNISRQEVNFSTSQSPLLMSRLQSTVSKSSSFQDPSTSFIQPSNNYPKDFQVSNEQNGRKNEGVIGILNPSKGAPSLLQQNIKPHTNRPLIQVLPKLHVTPSKSGTNPLIVKESCVQSGQQETYLAGSGVKPSVFNKKVTHDNSSININLNTMNEKNVKNTVPQLPAHSSHENIVLFKTSSESNRVQVSPISRIPKEVVSTQGTSIKRCHIQANTSSGLNNSKNVFKEVDSSDSQHFLVINDVNKNQSIATSKHSPVAVPQKPFTSFQFENSSDPSVFASSKSNNEINVGMNSSFPNLDNHSSLEMNVNFKTIKDESDNNFSFLDIIKEEYNKETDEVSESPLSFDANQSDRCLNISGNINSENIAKEKFHDVFKIEDTYERRQEINESDFFNEQSENKNENDVLDYHMKERSNSSLNDCSNEAKANDNTKERCEDKPYICPHCGFSVAMEMNMEIHIKSFHSDNKKVDPGLSKISLEKKQNQSEIACLIIETSVHKCSVCNFCTHRASNLEKHLLLEHNLISCSKCSYMSESVEDLKQHESYHKKIKCTLCNTMFSFEDYFSHLSVEHSVDCKYKCYYCEFRATAEWQLEFHLRNIHLQILRRNYELKENNENSNMLINCETSDKQNNEADSYSSKKKERTTSTRCRFFCKECGFRAVSKESLAMHENLHHPQQVNTFLNCVHCPFTALSKSDLNKHKHESHPEKFPYSCNECPVKYAKKGSLIEHIKIFHGLTAGNIKNEEHTFDSEAIVTENYGINNYIDENNDSQSMEEIKDVSSKTLFECRYCNFKTDKMKILSEHRYKVHSGHLFSCRLCIFRCSQFHKLKRHENNVHKIFNKEYVLYKCNLCKFHASEKYILLLHKLKAHRSKCNLKCNQCSYRASTVSCLRKHCLSIHQYKFQGGLKDKKYSPYNKSIDVSTDISCQLFDNLPNNNEQIRQNFHSRKVINVYQEKKSDIFFYHCEICEYKNKFLTEFQKHNFSKHNKYYECDNCYFVSDSLEKMYSHKSEFHSELNSYQCSLCNFCCASEKEMETHRGNIHASLFCYYCQFIALSSVSLNQHIKVFHPEKYPLKCNQCGYQTMNESFLSVHGKKKHPPTKCSYCSIDLESTRELFGHICSNHPEELPLQCDLCSFRTKQNSPLNIHKQKFHILKCSVCDFAPAAFKDLYHHIFYNHPTHYFLQCLMCSLSVDSYEDLAVHEINVHGRRIFRCKLCFYFADSVALLCTHIGDNHTNLKIKTHSVASAGQKKCKLCNFIGESTNNLYTHYGDTHPKQYPWKCSLCYYRTTRIDLLHRHEKRNHNKIHYLSCKYCNFKADTKLKIYSHKRRVHRDIFSYHCSSCSYNIYNKRNLKSHVIKNHGRDINKDESKPAFQCIHCSFWTRKVNIIKRHTLFSHSGCSSTKVSNEEEMLNDDLSTSEDSNNSKIHNSSAIIGDDLKNTKLITRNSIQEKIIGIKTENKKSVIPQKKLKFEHLFHDIDQSKKAKIFAKGDTLFINIRSPNGSSSTDSILKCYPEIKECYVVLKDIRHTHKSYFETGEFKELKLSPSEEVKSKMLLISSNEPKKRKVTNTSNDDSYSGIADIKLSDSSLLSETKRTDHVERNVCHSSDATPNTFTQPNTSSSYSCCNAVADCIENKSEKKNLSITEESFSILNSNNTTQKCYDLSENMDCSPYSKVSLIVGNIKTENTEHINLTLPFENTVNSIHGKLTDKKCPFNLKTQNMNVDYRRLLLCSLCKFEAQYCDLIKHGKNMHNCSILFTSDWCSYTSYDLPSLIKHINDYHHAETKCSFCPYRSIFRNELQNHQVYEHPLKALNILF